MQIEQDQTLTNAIFHTTFEKEQNRKCYLFIQNIPYFFTFISFILFFY